MPRHTITIKEVMDCLHQPFRSTIASSYGVGENKSLYYVYSSSGNYFQVENDNKIVFSDYSIELVVEKYNSI